MSGILTKGIDNSLSDFEHVIHQTFAAELNLKQK